MKNFISKKFILAATSIIVVGGGAAFAGAQYLGAKNGQKKEVPLSPNKIVGNKATASKEAETVLDKYSIKDEKKNIPAAEAIKKNTVSTIKKDEQKQLVKKEAKKEIALARNDVYDPIVQLKKADKKQEVKPQVENLVEKANVQVPKAIENIVIQEPIKNVIAPKVEVNNPVKEVVAPKVAVNNPVKEVAAPKVEAPKVVAPKAQAPKVNENVAVIKPIEKVAEKKVADVNANIEVAAEKPRVENKVEKDIEINTKNFAEIINNKVRERYNKDRKRESNSKLVYKQLKSDNGLLASAAKDLNVNEVNGLYNYSQDSLKDMTIEKSNKWTFSFLNAGNKKATEKQIDDLIDNITIGYRGYISREKEISPNIEYIAVAIYVNDNGKAEVSIKEAMKTADKIALQKAKAEAEAKAKAAAAADEANLDNIQINSKKFVKIINKKIVEKYNEIREKVAKESNGKLSFTKVSVNDSLLRPAGVLLNEIEDKKLCNVNDYAKKNIDKIKVTTNRVLDYKFIKPGQKTVNEKEIDAAVARFFRTTPEYIKTETVAAPFEKYMAVMPHVDKNGNIHIAAKIGEDK